MQRWAQSARSGQKEQRSTRSFGNPGTAVIAAKVASWAGELQLPVVDTIPAETLADIRAGRVEILGSDEDGWQLVNPDAIEEPEESRVDEYQRRIRDLKAQKAELDRGGQQALPDPDERTES